MRAFYDGIGTIFIVRSKTRESLLLMPLIRYKNSNNVKYLPVYYCYAYYCCCCLVVDSAQKSFAIRVIGI